MSYPGQHSLLSDLYDPRRRAPRIALEALCTEFAERYGSERHAFVVDLSATGLRIERPYQGGPTPRTLQLEFELPDVDEVIWARGEVCFDRVVCAPPLNPGGPVRLMRRTGVELVTAARDLRLLRDYVYELRRPRPDAWLPPGAEAFADFTL